MILARFRAHLTFANVVSLMALFVALSGGAYALTIPKHSVGAKQLKKNAVTSSKVKDRSLLARDFKRGQLPAGSTGPIGPAGPPGAPGQTGQPGSDAAGALMFRASAPIGFSNANTYLPVSGLAANSTTESSVTLLSPNASIVARDLIVHEPGGNGGGNPRHYTLRVNGTDTALTCTTVGNTAETCTHSQHAVTIPGGSQLSFHFTRTLQGAGSGDVAPQIAWRATTP